MVAVTRTSDLGGTCDGAVAAEEGSVSVTRGPPPFEEGDDAGTADGADVAAITLTPEGLAMTWTVAGLLETARESRPSPAGDCCCEFAKLTSPVPAASTAGADNLLFARESTGPTVARLLLLNETGTGFPLAVTTTVLATSLWLGPNVVDPLLVDASNLLFMLLLASVLPFSELPATSHRYASAGLGELAGDRDIRVRGLSHRASRSSSRSL